MDPLAAAISTILGKYAIDKGATLLKEAGNAAADKAAELFQKVMDRLKADPSEAKNAQRFEENPEGYRTVIADAVKDKLATDPNFAAEVKALVEQFTQVAGPAGASILNLGSGAIATQGGVAAGQGGAAAGPGGIAVVGTLSGSANINNDQSQTNIRSGGTDIDADQVDVGGDVTGRDKTSA